MTKLLELALSYNSKRVLDKARAEREKRLAESKEKINKQGVMPPLSPLMDSQKDMLNLVEN